MAQVNPRMPRVHGDGFIHRSRNHPWVISGHGLVDLYGKTLHERARALIGIAHPDDREMLAPAWCELTTCE